MKTWWRPTRFSQGSPCDEGSLTWWWFWTRFWASHWQDWRGCQVSCADLPIFTGTPSCHLHQFPVHCSWVHYQHCASCKGVHVLFAELLTVVQGARCSLGARSKSDHNQQWLHLNEGVCALPSQMMLTKIFEDNREWFDHQDGDAVDQMLAELCLKRCRTTTAGCGEHVDEDCDDDD